MVNIYIFFFILCFKIFVCVLKYLNFFLNIKLFVYYIIRLRIDVVKKGWYFGKRVKGIDIGL